MLKKKQFWWVWVKWAYLHDKIIKTVHIYSVIHKEMYIKNDYFAQKIELHNKKDS